MDSICFREKNTQVTPRKTRITKNRKVLASGLITRSLFLFFGFSSKKLQNEVFPAPDKDNQDDQGEDICHVWLDPFRELDPFPGVSFLYEVAPAPAKAVGTEEHKEDRKSVV